MPHSTVHKKDDAQIAEEVIVDPSHEDVASINGEVNALERTIAEFVIAMRKPVDATISL